MQGREVAERTAAWIIVAAVHVLVGAWLARWRGGALPVGTEDALNVEFIIRESPVPAAARREARAIVRAGTPSVQASQAPVRSPRSAASGVRAAQRTIDAEVAPALDLRVPELPLELGHHDPLARVQIIQARPTRFAHDWVPAGNALEQAGFRSKAVGVALSAFGGPPRRCTEIERRLQKVNCLQLHGQEADDEELRRRSLR